MKRYTVSARLGFLVGVFSVFLVVTALIAIWNLKQTNARFETTYNDRVVPLDQLKVVSDMYAVNIVDTAHKTRDGAIGWKEAREAIAEARKKIRSQWDAYLATSLTVEEKQLAEGASANMKLADAAVEKLAAIVARENREALTGFAAKEMYPAIDPVTDAVSKLVDLQLRVAKAEFDASMSAYRQVLIVFAILVAVALASGVLVSVRIIKQLLGELGGEPADAASLAHRIAQGDLSGEIALRAGDSSSLIFAMKNMQSGLRHVVGEIRGIVDAAANRGDFSVKMELAGKAGFMRELAELLNRLSGVTETGLRDISRVSGALARGDLSQKIEQDYPGLFGQTSQSVNRTVDALEAIVTEIRGVVDAAANRGDFGVKMGIAGKAGYALTLSELLNRWSDLTDQGLSDIRRVAQALANGDLTQNVSRAYPGVFGQTADAMNASVSDLQRLVGSIREAVAMIRVAAKEIAAGNQDLSARTEEQASSLEETASSMEQITGTVKQNADNANQASRLAQEAQAIAIRGGEVVGEVVRTMDGIHQSSRKISDIIGVIDGIAFQTNILALNAAVEAARAGEQGRGFAVVATEVRNLAQRSAGAAKEIKALISESVAKMENGNKLAEAAGSTMGEVVAGIKRAASIVNDISAASAEQSSGIEQIGKAVSQMDEATQQNAALVEEAAAASESLEDQGSRLAEAVAVFRLVDVAEEASGRPEISRTATKRIGKPPRAALPESLDDEWQEF